MKKLFLTLTVVVLLLTSCTTSPKKEKLQIYTSFAVIQDLTKKIVQDKADVHVIVENGEEPHDFELSTKMTTELAKADAIVYNGLGMESWVNNLKDNLKDKVFINTSNGIEVIKGDSHDHEGEQHEHHHEHNPHIWMSIPNAIKQMENIKNKMVELDTPNKVFYEKNFEENKAKFLALKENYDKVLKDKKHKTIVVSHAAYTYLAFDYDLEEHAISGFSPNAEPSLAKLVDLTKLVKEENVKTIFFDEAVSDAVSKVLAKESNVKTAVLYTLEKYPENEDYLSLMEKNLESLKKALNE